MWYSRTVESVDICLTVTSERLGLLKRLEVVRDLCLWTRHEFAGLHLLSSHGRWGDVKREGREVARKVVGLSERKQPPLNGPSAALREVEVKAASTESGITAQDYCSEFVQFGRRQLVDFLYDEAIEGSCALE